MVQSLFSYVVAFDSGFAPNPFHGTCTLATCKPEIRKMANIGDWIVGTGSANKNVQRGGFLVHAMRITEDISTSQYWSDKRFQSKKPVFGGSWVGISGDNIYEPNPDGTWNQLPSYHSTKDGVQRIDHTRKDTRVQRILISDDFAYFGSSGPKIPNHIAEFNNESLIKSGMGHRNIKNPKVITRFEDWFRSLGCTGICGEPWDWVYRMKLDTRDSYR